MDLRVKQIFDSQKLAVLSTLDAGFPYSTLVSFAATYDYLNLLFVTPRDTRKYLNLIKQPRVALLIDNRSNSATDLKEALAVTVLGEAREVYGDDEALRGVYISKLPALVDFVDSPQNSLFQVRITEILLAGFSGSSAVSLDDPD